MHDDLFLELNLVKNVNYLTFLTHFYKVSALVDFTKHKCPVH